MKTHFLFVAAALLVSARAESLDVNAMVATAEPAIERGYLRASSADIAAAVKTIDAALAANPKNPALLYERAFATFAASAPLRVGNKKQALIAALENAASQLEDVKGQPWEGEAAALRANILGSLIGLKGGMAGMTLGPKAGSLFSRAAKALPATNPRLLLFRGISQLNTPPAFGGNPAEAMKLLQQAVDVFASEASPPRGAEGPRWGRVDALTWLGIAKHKAGDDAAARAAWEQALAIEPDDGWVKFALLPSLDHKEAK